MLKAIEKEEGIGKKGRLRVRSLLLPFTIFLFTFAASSQRLAILAPDGAKRSDEIAARIEDALGGSVRIQDSAAALVAFTANVPQDPFNLTTERSKNIGVSIGCEYYILVRAGTLRRSASARPEYYEASAAIFVVSSRTGRLVIWKLLRSEAPRPGRAEAMLDISISPFAASLVTELKDITRSELAESLPAVMEEPPDTGSPAAKNFRAPIPYRRVKPKYTSEAYLYDIAATVEIVIDLDAAGNILRTEITRWAGYGLDESVEQTVRAMNWRPAERNGKPLPMRFLVRYNFKKIDKE
jgi:TonB family protein